MPDRMPRTWRRFGGEADWWMGGALGVVLLVGIVARSWVTLVPPLVVGDDGAYYLVQVRAILQDGRLAIPDFPLLFYLQALVARLLSVLLEPHAAIIAAVRLTDTLLPLALAVPVFLFARDFLDTAERPGKGAGVVTLVGLVAVASGNSLLMAGGMIKNSVALPCAFFFIFVVYAWLREGRSRTLAWATLWFVLASLTHMGGLILSAAFGVVSLLVGLAFPAVRPRLRLPTVVLLASLTACLAVVYALDPERAQRLVHALVAPDWLFAGSPGLLSLRGQSTEPLRALLTSPEVWQGSVMGVLGTVTVLRHRSRMEGATRVLLVASTLVTFAFSSPLLRPDVLERLALLAYVPGMIPVAYLVSREPRAGMIVTPLVLAVLLQGALAVKTLRQTALVPAAHEELVQFRTVLPPGKVIVITRPLLRWWVAWTMEAHFSTRVEPALAARDTYDAVLVLDEIQPGAFDRAPSPRGIGAPGVGVRDASLLPGDMRVIAEGEYFRLSSVRTTPLLTPVPYP